MKTILLILAALAVLFVVTLLAAFLVVGVYLYAHRDDLDALNDYDDYNDWE